MMIRMMKTTPPTTPPIIAPAFLEEWGDEWSGSSVGESESDESVGESVAEVDEFEVGVISSGGKGNISPNPWDSLHSTYVRVAPGSLSVE